MTAVDGEETLVIEELMGNQSRNVLLLDLGYGLPNEARPRREKLLAIAKQITNFLLWQTSSLQDESNSEDSVAFSDVIVAGCDDKIVQRYLYERILELWRKDQGNEAVLPGHFRIYDESIEKFKEWQPCYLSPDASDALSIDLPPPRCTIVGLLIDRRIQRNRSRDRASQLDLDCARLPLEQAVNMNAHEPLNVDCILEGMESWRRYFNNEDAPEEAFRRAMYEAITRHTARHPERPRHLIEDE